MSPVIIVDQPAMVGDIIIFPGRIDEAGWTNEESFSWKVCDAHDETVPVGAVVLRLCEAE